MLIFDSAFAAYCYQKHYPQNKFCTTNLPSGDILPTSSVNFVYLFRKAWQQFQNVNFTENI